MILIGEKKVKEFYESRGYKVVKINKILGFPDFEVLKNKKHFYVEEKTISNTQGSGLNFMQMFIIKQLIRQGEKVILAQYNSSQDTISFYKIDKNMGMKFKEEIKLI